MARPDDQVQSYLEHLKAHSGFEIMGCERCLGMIAIKVACPYSDVAKAQRI